MRIGAAFGRQIDLVTRVPRSRITLMKKLILGGVLALVTTAGAVYAYRTVHYNANRGDQPFTFLCPLTGKPMCHRACPAQQCEKAEAAAHPSCCHEKAAQAAP
jgi:hypothetical protein